MTTDFTINEHTALIEKMEANETFKAEVAEEQIQNLAEYFVTLPSEVAMKIWTILGQGNLNNTVRLHQSEVDGKPVSQHLVEILTGDSGTEETEEDDEETSS